MTKQLNFIEAESLALSMAHKQFFGEDPIGIAFTFIKDKKAGHEWNEEEKKAAKYISETAIRDLAYNNTVKLIESGIIPDCIMVRNFMATGRSI